MEQDNEYDLFVYSSALHHFKNPVELLELSAGRMHPQGMIVSIADPTTLIKSRRYRFFQFLATNREIKRHLIKECFQRMAKRSPAQKTDFDLAEYQTYTGIDDHQLCQDLSGVNLHPLLHCLLYTSYSLSLCPLTFIHSISCFSANWTNCRHRSSLATGCLLALTHPFFCQFSVSYTHLLNS